jgi:hypothetical protein
MYGMDLNPEAAEASWRPNIRLVILEMSEFESRKLPQQLVCWC